MEQRSWRRLCTHQEQQQPEQRESNVWEMLEAVIDVFMAAYQKLMMRIIFPSFVVYMIYQMAKAGIIL